MRRMLIAACVSTLAGGALSQEILGIGTMKCSALSEKISDPMVKVVLVAWFGGLASGVNLVTIAKDKIYYNLTSLNNVDYVAGAVVSQCIQSPNEDVAFVALKIVGALPRLPRPK